MARTYRLILIPLAIAVTLAVSLHFGYRLSTLLDTMRTVGAGSGLAMPALRAGTSDIARSAYPFPWQKAKRAQLRRLAVRPETPPSGTDAVSLALYAEYAARRGDEAIFREGMRRDPRNALYHYLLAEYRIRQAVHHAGEKPERSDAGEISYPYRVKDRALLDRAMREVRTGMALPYTSHRGARVQALLAALPEPRQMEDQLRVMAVMSDVLFPEYAKLRRLAFINGWYLSLLLAEGKRDDANPFLRTGERLAVQIAPDNPPTLIGTLVAMAIGKLAIDYDAQICRQFGLAAEAAEIERRQQALLGVAWEWKRTRQSNTEYYRKHGSILGGVLLPVFGQLDWVTPQALHPSRLLDFILVEEFLVTLLAPAFLLLALYAALKMARWRLAARDEMSEERVIGLSRAGWLYALGCGAALPLALYLAHLVIPGVSGRDHNIILAALHFAPAALLFVLWVLIVPGTIAAGEIWRQGIADGLIEPRRRRLERATAALLSLAWAVLAGGSLFYAAAWLVMLAVATPPLTLKALFHLLIALVAFALPLLPALWERRRAGAAHYRNLSRALIPIYATLALLCGLLYPALLLAERHFVARDQVMAVMRAGDVIAFTHAEGRLAQELRKSIMDGAAKLQAEDAARRGGR